MDEREQERGCGEKSGRKQEHAPGPQQPSEVDSERADKHERRIEGTVEPGAIVEAYANVPLQIGKAKTQHAPRKGHEPGAGDNTEDAEKRTRRYFRRYSRSGRMRDVYGRRANRDGRSCHRFPVTALCGQLLPLKVRDATSSRPPDRPTRS